MNDKTTAHRVHSRSYYRFFSTCQCILIGSVIGAIFVGGCMMSDLYQISREAPRRAAFERDCAHPIPNNPTNFRNQHVGQNACEVYPATLVLDFHHPYHDQNHWKYWLTIGTQMLKDEQGTTYSGNPGAINYTTLNAHWKNHTNLAVEAVFWKGQLMSISRFRNGHVDRVQTLSNPTTKLLNFQQTGLFILGGIPLFGLVAAFFGPKAGDTKFRAASEAATDESPNSPFDVDEKSLT